MGSSNPVIDEEPLTGVPPPVEPDPYVAFTTQSSMTNVLIETMMKNMKSIRVHLEQADSRTANGG